MVDRLPAPDSISLIIDHTSGPRISPRIWRDRVNRKLSITCSGLRRSARHAAVAGPLTRAGTFLPGVHDVVLLGQLVQEQLVLGLEGADHLPRVDLGAQRPHQGGLARRPARRTPRSSAAPSPRRTGSSAITGDRVRQSTRSARVTPRTRCRRIITDGRAVSRAAASREPSSSRRCSDGWDGRERARVLRPGGQELQEVEQLLVAVGDRVGLAQGAVGPLDHHPVEAR